MNTGFLNLDQILDIQKWQSLQDSLAEVTKLAIITVDYTGIPVTTHSALRPFCQYVRQDANLVKYCHKCDSRGGLEAVRLNAPYTYLCHCDVVDIAVPIVIDGQYIGATMAGQVRLPENEQNTELEKIMLSPNKNIFDNDELNRLYANIPVLPFREIQAVAQMLFNLCTYVVHEAIDKNLLIELNEQLGGRPAAAPMDAFSGYPVSSIELAKRVIGNAMTKAYIHSPESDRPFCKNPVLAPALDYIYENKGEMVTQKQMAALCHISISHFSRLFAKEIGEGFSTFLARQKVEWSKRLLEKTNLSVTQVSDEFGFSNPGYYIKTFKRYENITPAVYRRYYRERG